MKISEILDEAKYSNIEKILAEYFYVDGVYTIKYGLVNVDGNVRLSRSNIRLPSFKLPVKFGTVSGDFICQGSPLMSLENGPSYVGGDFDCSGCHLKTLNFSPKIVGSRYFCFKNKLTSFEGISETINDSLMFDYSENLPLLKLLTINRLKKIEIHGEDDDNEVVEILNKYLGKGRGGILACSAELTRYGFRGNARL